MASLRLKNGTSWSIESLGRRANLLVQALSRVMDLSKSEARGCRLLVTVGRAGSVAVARRVRRSAPSLYADVVLPGFCLRTRVTQLAGDTALCRLTASRHRIEDPGALLALAMVFASHAETGGGLLIHGALAQRKGRAVILAGSPGIGKTTASRRLPPPWRSLSDDSALIVRDAAGAYWVHPWPTWMNLVLRRRVRRWTVEEGYPLAGIFFLSRFPEDGVRPLPFPEAVASLVKRAQDCSWVRFRGQGRAVRAALRVRHLDNSCDIARAVPCRALYLTRHSRFWRDIEAVLPCDRRGGR